MRGAQTTTDPSNGLEQRAHFDIIEHMYYSAGVAGWPREVLPPGCLDWEISAVSFLLDSCPADFRGYPIFCRQPLVTAELAAAFLQSQLVTLSELISWLRVRLDELSPNAVEQAMDACQELKVLLTRRLREVRMVLHALQGGTFKQKL